MKLHVARLMAQGVDVRAAVLHHRQHAGRAGPRTEFLRSVRIAMTAVEAVEVSGLVRGVNRHPGESRLFQIEHCTARKARPQNRLVHGCDYGSAFEHVR
jgi:hypothetical protein